MSALNFSRTHANARFIANYLHANRFPCCFVVDHDFLSTPLSGSFDDRYILFKLNELYDYDILISYSMNIYCLGVIPYVIFSYRRQLLRFSYFRTPYSMPLSVCTVTFGRDSCALFSLQPFSSYAHCMNNLITNRIIAFVQQPKYRR